MLSRISATNKHTLFENEKIRGYLFRMREIRSKVNKLQILLKSA